MNQQFTPKKRVNGKLLSHRKREKIKGTRRDKLEQLRFPNRGDIYPYVGGNLRPDKFYLDVGVQCFPIGKAERDRILRGGGVLCLPQFLCVCVGRADTGFQNSAWTLVHAGYRASNSTDLTYLGFQHDSIIDRQTVVHHYSRPLEWVPFVTGRLKTNIEEGSHLKAGNRLWRGLPRVGRKSVDTTLGGLRPRNLGIGGGNIRCQLTAGV